MAGSLPPGNFAKLTLYRKFRIRRIVECFETRGVIRYIYSSSIGVRLRVTKITNIRHLKNNIVEP
jgi:hypothetical protein